MAIRRAVALTALTLGLVFPVAGCSAPTPMTAPVAVDQQAVSNDTSVSNIKLEAEEQKEIKTAVREAAQAKVEAEKAAAVAAAAEKAEADRVAAEQAAVEAVPEPEPVIIADDPAPAAVDTPAPAAKQPVAVAAPAPVAQAPAVAAPAPVPAILPVQAAPQAEQAVASRTIYVGLTGRQDVVDRGAGPVLWPLPGFPPYVAEHDGAGGWARFGSLQPGMKVTMTGLVGGTYTVGKIINVPKGGSTSELYAFGNMPKVMLQTCVPGTSRMIVVGLY